MKGLWLAAAVAGAVLTVAGAALGTTSGKNGKVAFESFERNHRQIGVSSANGAGWHLLTHTTDSDNLQADWSPNGKRIVFERDTPVPGAGDDLPPNLNVYVMNANGSGVKQLTHFTGVGGAEAPAWSPDGKRIAFDEATVVDGTCCAGAIYSLAADGTDLRQMTATDPNGIYNVQWSPDGTRFAFMSFLPPSYDAAIFVSKTDGSDERRLTEWSLDANSPDWSPNGSKIVFSSAGQYHADRAPNIFTIKPDGSGLRQLTHNPPGAPATQTNAPRSYAPTWSPDGKRIVFARTPGSGEPNEFADIFSMRANGTSRRLVTHTAQHWEENPDWGTAR